MNDNTINLYKWIDKTITQSISKTKDNIQIVIFYDFASDYFDHTDNKIRIGIMNISDDKIQKLINRMKKLKLPTQFDIVNLRLTLKYIKNIDQLEIIFKFINELLLSGGYVVGLINNDDKLLENIKNLIKNTSLYIKYIYDIRKYASKFIEKHEIDKNDVPNDNILIITRK